MNQQPSTTHLPNPYCIKGLKSFKGHEQEPLAQGTLHGPNGKVADWSDDSCGGEFRLRFVSRAAETEFEQFARSYLASKTDYAGKSYDVRTMNAWAITSTAVQEMSYDAQEEKDLRRVCKQGLAYYLPDASQPRGRALYTWKAPYTPETVAALRAKHPEVLEIANERLGLPFMDAQAYLDAERTKRWMHQCKTTILFTVRDGSGALKEMVRKTPYTTAHAADLRTKYPNLVEIINERWTSLPGERQECVKKV